MTIDRRQEGERGELEAARFLQGKGMRLLARNYFTRTGEVDLIMCDGNTVVFVEVKWRHSAAYGDGEESITSAKQRRIVRAAARYVQSLRRWDVLVRFDAVIIDPRGIRHYPSAFVPESNLTYY